MIFHLSMLYLGLAILSAMVIALSIMRYAELKNWEGLERAPHFLSKHFGFDLARRIRLSKQQLQTVFDSITDPICALDRDYRILRVNKSYARAVNLPIEDILGKTCFSVFWRTDGPCDNCPVRKTFAADTEADKKNIIRDVDKHSKNYEISAYPVTDESGATVNVIEYIRDVTEEKQILEQLIRSEKLATLGVMTAGIAHEMNNPLSGISGLASNMLAMPQKYSLNEKGVSRIQTILESAQRATVIMKDLLNFSRKQENAAIFLDLNVLIEKAISAIHLPGFSAIKKVLSLDKTLPPIWCDPAKIEQVIINLLTNAANAIAEKQAHEKEFPGEITLSAQRAGGSVRIDITDNGAGIPDAIKSRIFDPFFTTRPPGQGTGLGLCICQKIVQDHKGRILFESRDNKTAFSILLPLKGGLMDNA